MNQTHTKPESTMVPIKDTVLRALHELLEILDTPLSLGISLRLRAGDFSDLPKVDPLDYLERHGVSCAPFNMNPYRYKLDAQALACVKKLSTDFVQSSEDLELKALNSFIKVEEDVRLTNLRLSDMRSIDFRNRSILERAKAIVFNVLGETWKDHDTFTLKFGPGKTLSTRGRSPSHVVAKIGNGCSNTITPRAIRYFHGAILTDCELYQWACGNGILHPVTLRFAKDAFTIVNYDKFATVPKDYSKLRPIGVGPDINIILQLNAGKWIRELYDRYFGTTLRRVPQQHAALVELDSNVGAFATIDLQNASSTISYELVRFLLPVDWFDMLASLRTEYTLLPDGHLHQNEMFSAMGNGFTFELETLIFRSLVQATLDYREDKGFVSVYGDDIICPAHCASEVIATLTHSGFTINQEKTFITAGRHFRESCGSDWFDGVNVRPIYFKEFSDDLQGYYSLANRIAAVALCSYERSGFIGSSEGGTKFNFSMIPGIDESNSPAREHAVYDKAFIKPFRLVLKEIPLALRFGGPISMGDGVLHGLRPRYTARNSVLTYPILSFSGPKVSYDRLGSGWLQTSYLRLGLPSEGVTPRNEKLKAKKVRQFAISVAEVDWW